MRIAGKLTPPGGLPGALIVVANLGRTGYTSPSETRARWRGQVPTNRGLPNASGPLLLLVGAAGWRLPCVRASVTHALTPVRMASGSYPGSGEVHYNRAGV